MSYKISDPEDMIVHDERGVTHPGSMIGDQIAEKGLTVEEAAERIDMKRDVLNRVIDGDAPVDADVAERLGTLFGEQFTDLVYRWQLEYNRTR
ncbi:helix-turn-helix transcriptional regulator [Sphingomonas sp. Leaf257]|jgi:plasmid maintenance system antidote protein VapI|uniref:helix-turn-helix transcriptional regulator n=1 Tax=Sphingomonas sp. Leaf257 TaxID=1736309 RepID=UPI0006FB0286|nr:transcriptional regulator [Sphingomonas sp. Leaf257]KQO56454.1 hypothetical protein ASF14_18175 [Sphingomonas sp. Leaf257]